MFQKTKDDDKQALSIEDQTFLQIMDREAYQDDNHSWVAPLPFCTPRRVLPSNREQAMKHLHSLSKTLQRKPEVKRDFTEFIKGILDTDFDAVKFFTDSKTVLGYICSTTRRFHLYVSNRVNRINLHTQISGSMYLQSKTLQIMPLDLLKQHAFRTLYGSQAHPFCTNHTVSRQTLLMFIHS